MKAISMRLLSLVLLLSLLLPVTRAWAQDTPPPADLDARVWAFLDAHSS